MPPGCGCWVPARASLRTRAIACTSRGDHRQLCGNAVQRSRRASADLEGWDRRGAGRLSHPRYTLERTFPVLVVILLDQLGSALESTCLRQRAMFLSSSSDLISVHFRPLRLRLVSDLFPLWLLLRFSVSVGDLQFLSDFSRCVFLVCLILHDGYDIFCSCRSGLENLWPLSL